MKLRATFTLQIAVRILNGLASGQGLRAICRGATADALTLARDIAQWAAAERQWEAWQAQDPQSPIKSPPP